ncbi:MAG: DUF2325 domain-containing protein [Hyphomicrobiaceae bacterium]|nr:DUF2325 domain-containing protein [Hyphomicrobiaceae bacterium]
MSNRVSPAHHDPAIADYIARRGRRAPARRLALWQIDGGLQCSIIGTCLNDADLLGVIRRQQLRIARDAASYDIHSYCVHEAAKDTPLSRALTKLLDRRFAGAIRLVERARSDDEARAVWETLREKGQIAAGYWAIMGHASVSDTLKTRAFGEVHMLSHLNGHGAKQLALRLAEADRKIAELEARCRRSELAKAEALAERDRARSGRLDGTAARMPEAAPAGADAKPDRVRLRLAKCERALRAARVRARQAEEALRRHSAKAPPPPVRRAPEQPEAPKPVGAASARRILYLGGRNAIVPHLREVAAEHRASFLHHDGGIEDSLHRIEEMIEHSDIVVCPMDCVSHGACRIAKVACQKLRKRFVPIATASRTGFERALQSLAPDTPVQADPERAG